MTLPVTRANLARDLAALGLATGDVVMVHAGLRSVGSVLGGPDTLIAALRDVVGPTGTVAGYASWNDPYEDLLNDDGSVPAQWRDGPAFDAAASRATRDNGVLQEFLRTTPGARRSGNPGASIVAIGARADWLVADHPQDYGYGLGSPLAKLVEIGGRVAMIGCSHDTCTLLHLAEHLADVPGKRVISREVPFADADGVRWRRIEEYDTSEPVVDTMPENLFEQIVDAYLANGGGRRGRVGTAASVLLDAAPLVTFAVQAIERDYGRAMDASGRTP